MPFTLTDNDDGDICWYIEQVLKSYAAGEMSLRDAEEDLAHAMILAAVREEVAFKRYIRLTPAERAQV